MVYTAYELKKWSCDTPDKDNVRWIPARPITYWRMFERIKMAWFVLVGRFDALDWEDNGN